MHQVVAWIQHVLVPFLGPPGFFVVAFFDSSFLTIPEINDLLVVTSSSARPGLAWLYVTMTTLGSLAGCSLLWYLGRKGGEAFLVRRFGQARVDRSRTAFKRWDILALGLPAILPPPMPFKIFVLSAGVFGFSYRRFLTTLIVFRGFRYAFWGTMGVVYGEAGLVFLQIIDRWFAAHIPFILLLSLVIFLIVVLAVLLRRRWNPK